MAELVSKDVPLKLICEIWKFPVCWLLKLNIVEFNLRTELMSKLIYSI